MSRITAIDHIVLRSSNVERSLSFYCDALGMEGLRVEEWRRGEVRFPSVRASGETIIDLFPADGPPGPGEGQSLDHFCLVVEAGGLDEVLAKVESFGLSPGPKQSRWGARGRGESSYVEGPEGVTVELRHYPG